MKVFYNEIEPYAVEWLRNLERAGHIAAGVVEPRGIQELCPKDLEGFGQAHFFAGLGGWSYALKLAGWPENVPVWTGSCPCQPFSTSGRKKGFKDARHLWPTWFNLIRKCRPGVVFGEQVASPDGLKWFDLVCSDLERAGYAVGASDLCAAGVGAPHIRQRLYFVAVSGEQRLKRLGAHIQSRGPREAELEATRGRTSLGMAATRELGHASSSRSRGHAGAIPRAEAKGESKRVVSRRVAHKPELAGNARFVGDAGSTGPSLGPRPEERFGAVRIEGPPTAAPGATSGFWKEAEWWLCRDGKARPAQPGAFPLADRAAARVGRLRATGNAIVPQVAAFFIQAAMTAITTSDR